MVDIDDRARKPLNELVRKNLHVARQHHQVDLPFHEQLQLCFFGFSFSLFVHGNHLERYAVELRMMPGVRMIADDDRKVASKLAAALAVQEIDKTVVEFRYEDRHTRTMAGDGDAPVHVEPVRDRPKLGVEPVQVELEPG